MDFKKYTQERLTIKEANDSLYKGYLDIQQEAEKRYGDNTIVFMQVGSFFELYEADGIGKASDISRVLNIILTKKNKKIEKVSIENPLMCGVPEVAFENHLKYLIEDGKWTIVVIRQKSAPNSKKNDPKIRYVDDIISAGVNLHYQKSFNYNMISSLIIQKINNIYYATISFIDVSLGEVFVYENFGNGEDIYIAIDEIASYLTIYKASEMLISYSDCITDDEKEQIQKELFLDKMNIVKRPIPDYSINYQNEIIKKAFNIVSMISPIETVDMERMPLAVISLVHLIEFIIEHNPEITGSLSTPVILESQEKLYCGNNAFKQLNIVDDNELSLERIINKARTAVGRRYVRDTLLNPIRNREKIQNRYDKSSAFNLLDIDVISEIKRSMHYIYDIERLLRSMEVQDINPRMFYNLYSSIIRVTTLIKELSQKNFYLKSASIKENSNEKDNTNTFVENIENIMKRVEESFNIEVMSLFDNRSNNTFLNLDTAGVTVGKHFMELINERDTIEKNIEMFPAQFVQTIMNMSDYSDAVKPETFIEMNKGKLKSTEKEGHFIEYSKIRYHKDIKVLDIVDKEAYDKYQIRTFTNTVKITHPELKEMSQKVIELEYQIFQETMKYYNRFIKEFGKVKNDLKIVVDNVKELDFYLVNNFLFNEKGCSQPVIVKTKEGDKFIEAKGLRHLIVEANENSGIYIPNDFIIGNTKYINDKELLSKLKMDNTDKVNGIMLHGLNSSGKSTITKSVGISIIMAQAGFFVPAESFRYSLFDSLFTRISGSDDIYKGFSTFTIEMIEMKNIFNRSRGNTLVLGDELSHGTETQSAVSIVASGFLTLQKMDILFMFATHLHQLVDMPRIKNNKHLIPLHLHVEYDKGNDRFVFDRKLKYGSGNSTYGLEYARYLKLNREFLDLAYEIRKDIANDKSELELLIEQKKSNYNKDVYMTKCPICGAYSEESHHIEEQYKADDKNMIGHFHKNHKSNLVQICGNCHDKIHNGEIILSGFKMTTEGLILDYVEL